MVVQCAQAGPSGRLGRVRVRSAVEPLGQLALVLLCVFFYFAIRGLTQGSEAEAIRHGRALLDLEARLGLRHETALQDLVLGHRWLTNAANWVYIWGHWPVIAITLVWLHHTHRREYLLLRNAMFVSGAIGLAIFATYPVAPPRLLPSGFVDTVTELSRSYRVLQPPALVNKYAALPSLHAGWNLLVGIAVFRVTSSRLLRLLAVSSPLLMTFAVVATANHYVLDPLLGAVIVIVGLGASRAIARSLYAASAVGRAQLADQEQVVDDQPVHAAFEEPLREPQVLHGPGEDEPACTRPRQAAWRQQPRVERQPVMIAPDRNPAQDGELQPVARRSDAPHTVIGGERPQQPPRL